MTLQDLAKLHPEWLDHTLVIYTESGEYDYVSLTQKESDIPNWRGGVYEVDEMQDVEGKDCEPTGRKLLVFSPN